MSPPSFCHPEEGADIRHDWCGGNRIIFVIDHLMCFISIKKDDEKNNEKIKIFC